MTNLFPLTLGPHGSSIKDVLAAIGPSMQDMESSIGLILKNSIDTLNKCLEVTTYLCSALGFMGDMLQQAANMRFLGPRATFGCHFCLIDLGEYGILDFDVVSKGRY